MIFKYAIWDHFERLQGVSIHDQYQDKVRLLQEAERLGYYAYHIAEHHLTPLDLAPSPNVFLAALAQETSQLRFGPMVYILPLYHPVRLVQEICMLDNLSGGRLEIGIGRGVRPVEHEWQGADPDLARARMQEALEVVVSALTSGNIGYQGAYYQIEEAPLDMMPVQQPHPPIWYPGGADFAGRNGLNFLGRTSDLKRYWELWETEGQFSHKYKQEMAIPMVGVNFHVVVSETDAKAREIGQRAWARYVENFDATPLGPKNARTKSSYKDFDGELQAGERLVVGSPQTIKAWLKPLLDQFREAPSFYFSAAYQWGDITYKEAHESMVLMATEVLPALQPMTAGNL